MGKATKAITLSWRDENYGSVSGAEAFRFQTGEPLSDTARTKLLRTFKRHGFVGNQQRASFINEEAQRSRKGDPVNLVEALEEAGYVVTSKHCVPDAVARWHAGAEEDRAGAEADGEGPAFAP